MTEMQKFWVQRLLLNNSDVFESIGNSSDGSAEAELLRGGSARQTAQWQKLNSLFSQLRKCANHPYLFDGVESVSKDGEQMHVTSFSSFFFLSCAPILL